jgi:ribosomal protein S18 acetylase RimI-like enzyme
MRPLTCLDYNSVKDIFIEAFCKGAYRPSKMSKLWKTRNPETSIGIFSSDHNLLGFALSIHDYIARIAMHSNFQNQGLGSKLLVRVLSLYSNKNLAVTLTPLSNELCNYYARFGFIELSKDLSMYRHFYNTRRLVKKTPS